MQARPNPLPEPLFALHEAGFSFEPALAVLNQISAQVPAGRLTVILGPNGAGKSVLLSLLAGLRHPTAGTVCLAGRPLATWPAAELAAKVAWVPHQSQGGDSFSVAQMVAMGRVAQTEPLAKSEAAALRAMTQMELTALAHAPVGALSGGQRRRVMLARALAQLDGAPAGVLLLDEPDANLDPAQVVFLFEKLRLWVAQGLTVVAVVHDLHVAAEFADEAWLMQEGRLIEAGAAQEVLTAENLSRIYAVKVGVGAGWRVG